MQGRYFKAVWYSSERKEQLKALKQLKVVDEDLSTYLKIASLDEIKFTYYSFDTKWE